MKASEQANPAVVTPSGSKQAGEALRQRWHWVEATVWTERMLETLERGVKGGKWFALIGKVYDPRNLRSAYGTVYGNQGAAGAMDKVSKGLQRGWRSNSESWEPNSKRVAINHTRCAGCTLKRWGARRSGRSESRRCAIGWCKPHCET